jgi:hypothetical protein
MPHPYDSLCKCERCETLALMKQFTKNWSKTHDPSPSSRKAVTDFFKKHYSLNIDVGYTPPPSVEHYFVTISLPPNIKFEETNLIKEIKEIKYCHHHTKGIFEYIPHPHIHLLIKHKYINKYNLIKSFSKKLKVEKNFIDVKFSTDAVHYTNRENYINGEKTSTEKQELVSLDNIYKEKNLKIKSFIIENNNLTID